ncbi:MAG TPA: universal stress protein [Mucilaginibacter sp.]|nr:universal stress protein [Mucilaginibacter sp.]
MKISRILIAIDDSKYSEHAAEYGFELAGFYKADVGLVNTVEPIIPTSVGTTDMISPFDANLMNEAEIIKVQKEASENIIQRIVKTYGGDLNITHFTEYGSTADSILSCAAEFSADIIVVGTHSRHGLDRLLMGSVAEHVVRHSPIPVLVVPFPESESPHKSA